MRSIAAGILGFSFALGALAQGAYPNKPVTIVVGFEPGGGTDTTARILQKPLGELLGQQVVVENRAGAGGNIAVDYVAKSAPDGYMLVLANVGALAVNPHILKTPYDPFKDFAPISKLTIQPVMLMTHPSLPVRTVKEVIALARTKPGQLDYASSGLGGTGHLAGELFKSTAKIEMQHIPYKGAAPALTDLTSGQVQVMFGTLLAAADPVQGADQAKKCGACHDLSEANANKTGPGLYDVVERVIGLPTSDYVVGTAEQVEVEDFADLVPEAGEQLRELAVNYEPYVGTLVTSDGRAVALADIDALLTPIALTPPIPIDKADQGGTAAHFTRPVNYLGLCGLAVPNGFTAGGLPLGLQIVARAGDEATALRIGWAYETASDWKTRRPPER